MKNIKKLSSAAIAVFLLFGNGAATITADAHSGRTDSQGGHKDNKNVSGLGSYHYHHGYPAHLHKNGICPYESSESPVYPSESKAFKDSQAKINHLTNSLKTNYLGIKNQETWQLYIKQARDLISKIPSSENDKRDVLIVEVNKDEALVNALARINQVEKSIQPKYEGGYGNYLGIKNAETWRKYLSLAKIDLEKVDKSIFQKQYEELVNRMNKVSITVKDIEDNFQVEYDKAVKVFEEAKSSNNIEKAKVALVEAEKLGTCDRSDQLENDIKNFLKY